MELGRRAPRPCGVNTPIRFGLVLLGAFVLAACSMGPGSGSALEGRTFLSTAVTDGGEPFDLVPDTQIRLAFADGQLSASAGCNSIGGTYRVDGGTLVFEGGGMTEMGCDPDRHAQDDWLSELLGSRPAISLAGNDLTITAGGTVIGLLDREVAQPDLALAGTLWTVDALISGDAVSSVPDGASATLRFNDDGTVEVNTGCNSGQGGFEVDGAQLRFIEVTVTETACDGVRSALEAAVLPILGADELTFAIDANRLTLMAGDAGLGLAGT